MRSLHTMYKIILNDFEQRDGSIKGICQFIINAKSLTVKERNKLLFHFTNNKPRYYRYREFWDHESFTANEFWWDSNHPESTNQRYLFIQKMIEITKPIPFRQRIIQFFKSWMQ